MPDCIYKLETSMSYLSLSNAPIISFLFLLMLYTKSIKIVSLSVRKLKYKSYISFLISSVKRPLYFVHKISSNNLFISFKSILCLLLLFFEYDIFA